MTREELNKLIMQACERTWNEKTCKEIEQALSQEPTDAVSRILNRMWNCRGKHTTSIDKVAMEQIIRDELTSVTPKSIECDDAISRDAVLKKIDDEVEQLPSVTQKSTGCDDAISREAVLEGLKGCICEEWIKTLFATMVKQLPPVTQKSGRWKVHRKYYECSSCGSQISNEFFVNYRFCPHCGARMESEE